MFLHEGKIMIAADGKKKGVLKKALQMNVIRSLLLKLQPKAVETYGYTTSANHKAPGFNKAAHYMDTCILLQLRAIAISSYLKQMLSLKNDAFLKAILPAV